MIHHLQLQINDLWQSFFFMGPDLEESCQLYRELRAALRAAGVTYRCRLKRVAFNNQRVILRHREAHPEVARVIDAFCDVRCQAGQWNEEIIEHDDDPLRGEA
jgi:hypothetical protein